MGFDPHLPWRRMLALYRRPAIDRELLWKALFMLAFVRLGLRFGSLGSMRRRLRRRAERAAARADRRSQKGAVDRVRWAVDRAAWLLPGTKCLPRALVGQTLLAAEDRESRLRVGARRDLRGRLSAHAWIERNGIVLIGGADSPAVYQTVPLSLFEGAFRRRRIFSND